MQHTNIIKIVLGDFQLVRSSEQVQNPCPSRLELFGFLFSNYPELIKRHPEKHLFVFVFQIVFAADDVRKSLPTYTSLEIPPFGIFLGAQT